MIGNTDLANTLCHVMSNLAPYLEEWLIDDRKHYSYVTSLTCGNEDTYQLHRRLEDTLIT